MLTKQPVEIALQGFNDDVGALTAPTGTFEELLNVYQSKSRQWHKRGGFRVVATENVFANEDGQSPAIDDIRQMTNQGEGLLIRTKNRLYAQANAGATQWRNVPGRGTAGHYSLSGTGPDVVSIRSTQAWPGDEFEKTDVSSINPPSSYVVDSIVVDGMLFIARSTEYGAGEYGVLPGNIYVSVQNIETGVFLIDNELLTTGRCALSGDTGKYSPKWTCVNHNGTIEAVLWYASGIPGGDHALYSLGFLTSDINNAGSREIACLMPSNTRFIRYDVLGVNRIANTGYCDDVWVAYSCRTEPQTEQTAWDNIRLCTYMDRTVAQLAGETADGPLHWPAHTNAGIALSSRLVTADTTHGVKSYAIHRAPGHTYLELYATGYGYSIVVDATATTVRRMSGFHVTGGRTYIFYDNGLAVASIGYTAEPTVTRAYHIEGTIGVGFAPLRHRCIPSSRWFSIDNGAEYTSWRSWVTYGMQLSSDLPYEYNDLTQVMVDMDFFPHAQAHNGLVKWPNGGNLSSDVSTVWVFPGNRFKWGTAGLACTRLLDGEPSMPDVRVLSADFANAFQGQPVACGSRVLFPGGVLAQYDGARFCLEGFINPPAQPLMAASGYVPTPALSTGTSQCVICYTWRDAAGNTHRSAPSNPSATFHNTTGGRIRVDFATPELLDRLAEYSDTGDYAKDFQIEVYRTQDGPGSIYYLAGIYSVEGQHSHDGYREVTDGATASKLLAGEVLYTAGGVLPAECPPACDVIAMWQNRVVLGGCERGEQVWFSTQMVAGEAPRFSSAQALDIVDEHGDVTALAAMGDKLIIFKKSAIYAIVGQGPDAAGDGMWPYAEKLQTDKGTIEPRSVVVTPDGVIFKSSLGFELLDNSLNVQFLGAQIKDMLGTEFVTGSSVDVGKNQVRFVTTGGHVWIWDWHYKQWYKWSLEEYPHSLKASCSTVNGYWVTDGHNVFSYSPAVAGDVLDPGDNSVLWTPIRLRTSRINLAGVDGYQRLFELRPAGYVEGVHKLVLTLDTNNASDEDQTETRECTSGYGASTWAVRFQPAVQKCAWFQLTIADEQVDGESPTLGLSLETIRALVGVNKLANKAGADNSISYVAPAPPNT